MAGFFQWQIWSIENDIYQWGNKDGSLRTIRYYEALYTVTTFFSKYLLIITKNRINKHDHYSQRDLSWVNMLLQYYKIAKKMNWRKFGKLFNLCLYHKAVCRAFHVGLSLDIIAGKFYYKLREGCGRNDALVLHRTVLYTVQCCPAQRVNWLPCILEIQPYLVLIALLLFITVLPPSEQSACWICNPLVAIRVSLMLASPFKAIWNHIEILNL